jgi:hypothetical protein
MAPLPGCRPPPTSWWWDGAAWRPGPYAVIPEAPSVSPAQDPRHAQLSALADGRIWGWDGSRWVPHTGPLPLGDRSGVALAADAARRTVVAVGGLGGDAEDPGGDTWTWDGHDWSYRGGVLPMVGPVVTAETSGGCSLAASPDVTARPDGRGTLTLRIRVNWTRDDGVPTGCTRSPAVSVRIVDAVTHRRLNIPDNDHDVKPRAGQLVLTWTNWCPGPGQVAALSAQAPGGDLFWRMVAPPPCLDPGRPSMLSVSPGS